MGGSRPEGSGSTPTPAEAKELVFRASKRLDLEVFPVANQRARTPVDSPLVTPFASMAAPTVPTAAVPSTSWPRRPCHAGTSLCQPDG